jgi:hypothetical protein
MEILVIIWLVCAALGWVIGDPKGRGGLGVVLGLLLGLIGLIIIAVLPPVDGAAQRTLPAPLPPLDSSSGSLSDQLVELDRLRGEGLLTEAEFTAAKRRLLGI